jgi:hypothetical protein
MEAVSLFVTVMHSPMKFVAISEATEMIQGQFSDFVVDCTMIRDPTPILLTANKVWQWVEQRVSSVDPQIPGNGQFVPNLTCIYLPTPTKHRMRAIIVLINNLSIIYHQYCSSSYVDYSIIFGPFCCPQQWKSSSNLTPTR